MFNISFAKKYDRLFTFGCSYTHWIWPTWADIIAYDTGLKFYNYGIGGIGNIGISTKLILADYEHKFTKNDLVLIMWSSWMREDRYLRDQGWSLGGNVFNNFNYDENFLQKYWSLENDYLKNSTIILHTQRSYKEYIKCEGSMIEVGHSELDISNEYVSDKTTKTVK